METLFSTAPFRKRPPRGKPLPTIIGRRWRDPWPPPTRDPDDIAVVATRLLATAGRLQTRLRRTARRHGVDPRVFRFLLLFAERTPPLRVTDVAEHMGVSNQTASRIVTLALEAGLVDLRSLNAIDGREVAVRLTVAGRDAVTRCLDAIRADAAHVGVEPRSARRGSSGAHGIRYMLRYGDRLDDDWAVLDRRVQGP
ncbi:MAG TPA: MarR family transcriptional regulator [Acidimicrobiia bacterium]|jgi:DNA-binding MarR family transcriptional regulator|nr:MarR family transcriptional regulator [Acidimicrobiia bacterium]